MFRQPVLLNSVLQERDIESFKQTPDLLPIERDAQAGRRSTKRSTYQLGHYFYTHQQSCARNNTVFHALVQREYDCHRYGAQLGIDVPHYSFLSFCSADLTKDGYAHMILTTSNVDGEKLSTLIGCRDNDGLKTQAVYQATKTALCYRDCDRKPCNMIVSKDRQPKFTSIDFEYAFQYGPSLPQKWAELWLNTICPNHYGGQNKMDRQTLFDMMQQTKVKALGLPCGAFRDDVNANIDGALVVISSSDALNGPSL